MFINASNATFNNKMFSDPTIRWMATAQKDPHPSFARLLEASHLIGLVTKEQLDDALNRGGSRAGGATAIARALNESPQSVNNWMSRGVSKAGALKAQSMLGISPTWILEGVGAALVSVPQAPAAAPAAIRENDAAPQRQVTESEWALLRDFEMLPDDEKHAIRSTLKAKADHVRKIVAEYLGRQGMTGTASDARVGESFGPAPSPAPAPTGAGSYEKITPSAIQPPVPRTHKVR